MKPHVTPRPRPSLPVENQTRNDPDAHRRSMGVPI
jgi:hypothetical protein